MSELAPGQVVAGRYRLIAPIGRGSMGSVWRAEHGALGAPVAIKLLDPSLFDPGSNVSRDEVLARFFREAKAAATLRGPHVVQILDHGMDGGVAYMVMELLEGETLADRLQRLGTLSPDETARILVHVARAIGRAHEAGIVHRDLKPGNIWLLRNDDEEVAKVIDFGIAKVLGPMGHAAGLETRSGHIVGTPCYMSPEQAEGTRPVDHRSDLWAMAVIAFECLVGKRPFESEGLGELVLQICARPIPVPSKHGRVPAGFDAWFARATQRNPDKRFQSAKELADSLRAVLAPTAAPQPSGAAHAVALPIQTGASRSRSWIALVAAAAAGAGVVGAVLLLRAGGGGAASAAGAPTVVTASPIPSVSASAPEASAAVAAPIPPSAAPSASAPPPEPTAKPAAAHEKPRAPKITATPRATASPADRLGF